MLGGLTDFFSNLRYNVFGYSYLSTFDDTAIISCKGQEHMTPEELEDALKKTERFSTIQVGFANHGYGCIAGCTPQHEAVLAKILETRATKLESLRLLQNGISGDGMAKIIDAIKNNFNNLGIKEFIVTKESVEETVTGQLKALKEAYPNLKIVIREFGTQRDPGTGSGYDEEIKP